LARLKIHQLALFSQVLGGPFQYTSGMLAEAHARFSIERRHFDAFVANVESALREMGTPPLMVTEVISRVTDLASSIVNTASTAAAVI
jgi:hemoglobin